MSKLVRTSLSIDESLFDKLEDLVRESGYSNRSEYIRDLIRDQLVQREWARDTDVVGTISLVFDHEVRDLGARLTHVQHHHLDEILASTHIHLDERLCAEIIVVRGRAATIRHLAGELKSQRGVLHASLSLSSTGKALA